MSLDADNKYYDVAQYIVIREENISVNSEEDNI
jgi:hypothetical protein